MDHTTVSKPTKSKPIRHSGEPQIMSKVRQQQYVEAAMNTDPRDKVWILVDTAAAVRAVCYMFTHGWSTYAVQAGNALTVL